MTHAHLTPPLPTPRPTPRRAHRWPALMLALPLALCAGAARTQVLDCTLNGESVSPYNGATTAGKTGLMRCVDRETKVIARESELRNGTTAGVQRWYEAGVLRREQSVNEKGNRDGRSREWNARGVLTNESHYADSDSVGLHREWYEDGTPRSIAHWGDERARRSEALSRQEFDRDGKLSGLRCGPVPRLEGEGRMCGHDGEARTTDLHARGKVAARVTYQQGKLQRRESLRDDGTQEAVETREGTKTTVRNLWPDGKPRREMVSIEGRRVLDASYTERGTPLKEQRWADGLIEREAEWYLNGQPRRERVYERSAPDAQGRIRVTAHVERSYFDTGKLSGEGRWGAVERNGSRMVPVGAHRTYDAEGRVRMESVYDERGRLTREREWDEQGKVSRDDEVYEDGSRKRP